MRTIMINGIVLTMNRSMDWYPDGYVMFEENKILQVGSMDEIAPLLEEGRKRAGANPAEIGEAPADWKFSSADDGQQYRIVDAARGIILPGMVNTHCHLGMVPFRGLGDDCKDRLRVFLLPMEQQAMDAEMTALSSRYALSELLLAGVTTVMDMYYFEGEVAKVMDQMGIRGIAGETVMEQGACDVRNVEEAIAYGEAIMKEYQHHPRVSCCLAPHGTTTCSPETLKRVYDLDRKYQVPFTLHTAEMDYELKELKERFGCTPVEFLHQIGVLGPLTVAAHSIHLSETDIRLLQERNSRVSHCIVSNTKAAKGVAPVLSMLESGIPVGLGTDGPASGNTLDLFTQMHFCANFHKNESRDRSALPAKDIVAMATIGGARALGLDGITGSLEPGKEADLVLVETDSINMFPVYDPYSALVYSANSSNVKDVYVAGKQLVAEKELVCVDRRRVRRQLAEKMKDSAFGRMEELAGSGR